MKQQYGTRKKQKVAKPKKTVEHGLCPKCAHPLIRHRKPPAPWGRKFYQCQVPGCEIINPYYGNKMICHISGADFKDAARK